MKFKEQLDEAMLKQLLEEEPKYDVLPALAKIVQETIASELEKEVEDAPTVSEEELLEDLESNVMQAQGLALVDTESTAVNDSQNAPEEMYTSPSLDVENVEYDQGAPAQFVAEDKSEEEEEEQRRRIL